MKPITTNTTLEEIECLSYPCSCSSCSNGCHFGSGVFVDGQLKELATFLKVSEKEVKEKFVEKITKFNTTKFRPKILREKNKPYGRCIFFDDAKGCTIHEVKPQECKLVMPCKKYSEDISVWFMVKEFVNPNDNSSIKEYESYLKSGGKQLPGASIKEIKLKKEKTKTD